MSQYQLFFASDIVAHHILPHTLCSESGRSGQRLATVDLSGGWLPFSRDDQGTMTIGSNGTKINEVDIVATNGVLHVAEGFVIPPGGKYIVIIQWGVVLAGKYYISTSGACIYAQNTICQLDT